MISAKAYIYFLLGALVGFLFHYVYDGKKEGDNLNRSIRFRVGSYYLHFHHWLYSALILIGFYLAEWHYSFVYGFLTGSVLQGLTYRDWYLFIYHKDDFEKIYSKWRNPDFFKSKKK